MDNVLIGAHVSMSGPKYFLGSVEEAIFYNATTLMFYTGAPQNSIRTPVEKCHIDEAIKLAKEKGLNPDNFVCHAPYIINLGNIDEEKFEFSKQILKKEIERCEKFFCNKLVLHPGLHVGNGEEIGINQIIKGLNEVIDNTSDYVTICIETMAGKGSEIGKSFEEVERIIDGVKNKNRIGVCLDTCHINDAGYLVNDIDDVLNTFDKTIGLQYLKVIHLNDSKNIINSHKDRHENIGFGTIGFDSLIKYVFDERLKNIPKILETPYVDGHSPYKYEIEMILNKSFDKELLEKIKRD